jgi:hypothetical protein
LHSRAEQARMTRHERVLRWELSAPEEPALRAAVDELVTLAVAGDDDGIRRRLKALVPEYHEPGAGEARTPPPDVVDMPGWDR